MERESVEDLVRRCQRTLPEDTHAFESLVTLFKGRVFRIAYRLMCNTYEAEDQTQEVFLKVYRHLQDLSDPALFVSWLDRITTNTCLDALTRQRRRPIAMSLAPSNADGDEYPTIVDARMLTPEEAALLNELRLCLETTLAQLDTTARTVLVLRDIEDRPYTEIAESLGIGLSALKMRIHRSRLAFQRLLQKICPGSWQSSQRTPV